MNVAHSRINLETNPFPEDQLDLDLETRSRSSLIRFLSRQFLAPLVGQLGIDNFFTRMSEEQSLQPIKK